MAKRLLKVGERIWDAYDRKWGTIIYFASPQYKQKEDVVSGDTIVGYKQDGGGENETIADDVYQIAEGKSFHGEHVVWEHSEDIDYPFYCPARDENCYHVELD